MHELECIIVGGGPAGLMAAVYLARYKRRAVVIDEGASRAAMIPKSRNVLGFPDGIAGQDLLERMREHAAKFGAAVQTARVDGLARQGDVFEARAGATTFRAPFVILATGARDVEPEVTGLAESLQTGHVRYCPVCDGYETQGRRVAVIGRDLHGLRESAFVAGFDNEVTWLSLGTHGRCEEKELERLRAAKVTIVEQEPRHVHCDPKDGIEVEMKDGTRLRFDVLYPALGLEHRSGLAAALGAQVEADGQLVVTDHFETTVPGLFAAGDVASGLNQINVAAGQAAIAATEIHNRLP
ncbi:NAD(P)/FAD-dependent oxidoreductase [Ramlibacter sp. PS4R-6]|uniref:NAD(P)/FAD-dependent oxidoreductase n=1 Tax=Ramlibacter sp. PS4R-6 TaxID=3133438 RepID=UPI00309F12BE